MKTQLTIVINALQGGGAERVAVTVANYLVQNGYEIHFTVLNLHNSVYQDVLDKKIRLTNLNIRHARNSFFAFSRFLRTVNPETILVFNHELAVVLSVLRMVERKKFALIARNINTLSETKKNERSFWHKYVKNIIVRNLYNKTDQIIAQSDMMKTDLVNHYRVSADKIVVINNPVAPEFEQINEKGCIARQKTNEILFIGRLEQQKGLKYLLEAFRLVLARKPQTVLRILGQGSLQSELIRYAEFIGIKNNVIFDGYKREIIPCYLKAKLTVLSSLYEGFPNVLVESVYCGTPVVAFDCKSGPAEIIEEGVNGFLVEYLNTEHLAEKIIDGLNKNWDSAAIRNTATRFSAENIIKNYIEVLSTTHRNI